MLEIETTTRVIHIPTLYEEVPVFANLAVGSETENEDLTYAAIENAERLFTDYDFNSFADLRCAYVLGVLIGACALVLSELPIYETDRLRADAYMAGVADADKLLEQIAAEENTDEETL
jgi:hypothetical protein